MPGDIQFGSLAVIHGEIGESGCLDFGETSDSTLKDKFSLHSVLALSGMLVVVGEIAVEVMICNGFEKAEFVLIISVEFDMTLCDYTQRKFSSK